MTVGVQWILIFFKASKIKNWSVNVSVHNWHTCFSFLGLLLISTFSASHTMLAFACANGAFLADEFLEFFKTKDEACFNNYVALAKQDGVYEQFKANPLATILTMGSPCCMDYAKEFCVAKTTCPFKAGQILWQRSICDSTTFFEYQIVKVCKKTVTVRDRHGTYRCKIELVYDPKRSVSGWSAWRLVNSSRRIFLNYAERR